MQKLEPIDLAVHQAKVQVHRLLRWIDDRRDPITLARSGRLLVELPLAIEDRSLIWNEVDPREWPLELGKVENLRVAARALDGLEFEARQVFSFWAQVGPPVRARGYVTGRELREGCVVPGIGGGLCLLSNSLYGAARRAGFELLERHAHSRRPPGSRAALGEDATVAWNYIDLRFVANQPWRLEVRLDAEALIVGVRTERRRNRVRVLHERRSPEPEGPRSPGSGSGSGSGSEARWAGESGASCMSCDRPCSNARSGEPTKTPGRRSWLVDAAWPEYTRYLRAHGRREDRLLQPIDGVLLGQQRYAWPREPVGERVQFPVHTLARSLRSRRLASQGPARQRALLDDDRRLATAMAARLEPEDTDLVVAQNLLGHLWRMGALGGRRVSVLMQRLPLIELQAQLDEAHSHNRDSPTLADFRTDPWLAEAEACALDDAAQIITPHTGVAACYPGKTNLLDWALESAPQVVTVTRSRAPGPLRLWLPTSSVGRKGVWELREALSRCGPVHLWVSGRELEGDRFWSACGSVTIQHGSPALASVDALVLPAWIEHQPRALLRAIAAGVPVIASGACGLQAQTGVHTITAGDIEALREAIVELRDQTFAGPRHRPHQGEA